MSVEYELVDDGARGFYVIDEGDIDTAVAHVIDIDELMKVSLSALAGEDERTGRYPGEREWATYGDSERS